jgi:hypothetical protein
MGCGSSQGGGGGGTNAPDPRRIVQQKAPILLFSLPGSGRDAMLRTINSDAMSATNSGGEPVNVRFIDIPNHRSSRRYWIKDLQARKDYAAIFFLADVREHPTLLFTARTLNWFLRSCPKTFEIKLIVVYTQDSQLQEFRDFLPEGTEMFGLSEKDPETVAAYMRLLQTTEKRFVEQRRNQTTTKPML